MEIFDAELVRDFEEIFSAETTNDEDSGGEEELDLETAVHVRYFIVIEEMKQLVFQNRCIY